MPKLALIDTEVSTTYLKIFNRPEVQLYMNATVEKRYRVQYWDHSG